MPKLSSLRPLMTLLAMSSLTLTACASSPASSPTGVPASDVVTRTVVQTQIVCPAELDQPAPAQPGVPADAKVTANASGAAYVAALIAWGQGVAKLFGDAATACKADAQAVPQGDILPPATSPLPVAGVRQ